MTTENRRFLVRCLVDLLAMLFVTFTSIPNAMANSGCSHDCAKCHRITKDEVTKVLNANTPGGNVKVMEIKMSPVKGVWEIVARQGFKTGIFYLDFKKEHLIYGAIVGTRGEKNLTKASFEKNTRLKVSELKEGSTLLLGTKDASIKLYIFSDPTCSHCAEQHKILKQTVKERPDIAVHIVLFPLKDINPDSYSKAQTVYCANSLKALEDSYAWKKVTASSCDLTGFSNNIAVGQKYGITGTPTTVFADGTIYFGNIDQKALLARLEETKR